MFYGVIQKIIDNDDYGMAFILWDNTRVLYNIKSKSVFKGQFKIGDKLLAWGKFEENLKGMGIVDLIVYDLGEGAAPYVTGSSGDVIVNPSNVAFSLTLSITGAIMK